LGFFFSFSSIAFSLVYCRCTKGCLTLLIKPGYYLSKKSKSRKEDSAPCPIISFKELRYQEIKCCLEIVHIIKQIMLT
jgi:hypothetical protein